MADRVRVRIRVACGRAELPTAAVIDAQTVRGADTVAADSAGCDTGKKTKGRKRNIATDCLGLLLMVTVTAASVQDRDSAHRLLALLHERVSTISLVWADGGYAGRLVTWAHKVLRLAVTIVKRTDNIAGFVVLPQVGRRADVRLAHRHRRLVRDYERRPEHHEAMVWWATVTIMTRRLNRELTGDPPPTTLGSTQTSQPCPSVIIYEQALRSTSDRGNGVAASGHRPQ